MTCTCFADKSDKIMNTEKISKYVRNKLLKVYVGCTKIHTYMYIWIKENILNIWKTVNIRTVNYNNNAILRI